MKQVYVPKNFTPPSLEIIEKADEILNDYTDQGYTLTLRQLYYQFVARDLMAKRSGDQETLQQESNLDYVTRTRAIRVLVFQPLKG